MTIILQRTWQEGAREVISHKWRYKPIEPPTVFFFSNHLKLFSVHFHLQHRFSLAVDWTPSTLCLHLNLRWFFFLPPPPTHTLFSLIFLICLLDLSAAFDTLDYPILLQRLETTFGISGTVLHWFASYLEGREQSVMVDSVLSSPSPFQFGVPQGSVLGPVLFTLYSQPLSDLICCHKCNSLMIPSCQRGLLPINFSLFSVISRPALKVLQAGCTATSSN